MEVGKYVIFLSYSYALYPLECPETHTHDAISERVAYILWRKQLNSIVRLNSPSYFVIITTPRESRNVTLSDEGGTYKKHQLGCCVRLL